MYIDKLYMDRHYFGKLNRLFLVMIIISLTQCFIPNNQRGQNDVKYKVYCHRDSGREHGPTSIA